MIRTSLFALGVALLLAGCTTTAETTTTPHGYVAGAEESPEARSALAYAARGSRLLHILDIASGQERQIALSAGAQRIVEDGRFVYVSDGDRTVEIVDAGVWTVDHTDHVHYYRAAPRNLGTLAFGAAVVTIAGFGAHTTIGTADGTVHVYDRRRLEAGEVAPPTTVDTGSRTPLAVPYAGELLVTEGDDRIVTSGGFEVPCVTPRGWAVLRGGAVISCDGSLVRVRKAGEKMTAEVLEASGPLGSFGHRPRSNEAAAVAGDGIWSVNAAKATLRHLPVPDLVAAASPADGSTVLALDRDGTLLSYDLASGAEIAEAPLRATTLTLDIDRAYLATPADRVIHEIDYRDGLRTARTLRTSEQPDLVVEVGR